MQPPARLAFVDVETTGLDPAADRIIEVGVVTVDGTAVDEWTTLINPRSDRTRFSRLLQDLETDEARELPRFRDVAASLAARLENRLFVAHNARFDYGFLRAEFERVGIRFEAPVVCSLMLSRMLYGRSDRHDLDALIERHALPSEQRHRALPDARAIFRLWDVFHRDHPRNRVEKSIDALLAGPALPHALDAGLIDRVPEAPGIYVLHGGGEALHVGRAVNLRRHLLNYFRLDSLSDKARALSHLVDDITWRSTSGRIGTRVLWTATSKMLLPSRNRSAGDNDCSWRFDPSATPVVWLDSPPGHADSGAESFGMFRSERKARNALLRLAVSHGLCHTLLGLPEPDHRVCVACRGHGAQNADRLKHLARAYTALLPWRIREWPYPGPIAIREWKELHVFETWRYLGTARGSHELHAVLRGRRPAFDRDIYGFLARTLPRLNPRRIVPLDAGGSVSENGS